MNSPLFGLLALVPLMLNADPAPANASIKAPLCNGGSIAIPLGEGNPPPEALCDVKGCHAGCPRKRFDRTQ